MRAVAALLRGRYATTMKIYVLGSNAFMHEMVATKNRLCELGYDGWIHPDYEELVAGKRDEQIAQWNSGEQAKVKKEHDYIRQHYRHIIESDAILFVNNIKNCIANYIGGNVLIEMGQAHVHNKPIYFLYGMPQGLSYMDEIIAMDPICLDGN